jgi:hypothetical protein
VSDAFAKSILNYFATYTETRFRFNTRLPFAWEDNALTLDLSVYPDFEKQVLACLSSGQPLDLEVRPGDYAVCLDMDEVRRALSASFESFRDPEALGLRVSEFRKKLEEAGIEGSDEALNARALQEALRIICLETRKEFVATLTRLQTRKVEDLRVEYGFQSTPQSTFNPQLPAQRFYDGLTASVRKVKDPAQFILELGNTVAGLDCDITIFDLHLSLRSFFQTVRTQTVHLFFHQLAGDTNKGFPLFSMEISGADGEKFFRIRSGRDWVMLNTPAVNCFAFDGVLTTPRACALAESKAHLDQIERFFQAKYKKSESFLLSHQFDPLVGEQMPTLRFRMGLQALAEEDRRLLDYSELMTSLQEGGGKKFKDMLGRYLEGNCTNTSAEVEKNVRERYPRGSAERLTPKHSDIPLPLNDSQRRILTAVENPVNELMVVDGPPGTGKSYTITALVYHAASMGKSVVITSHKQQALDVIDDALTEQFRKVHPQSKPAVLRLQSGKESAGINSLENTLSSAAVNAASRRAGEFNTEAVETDRERNRARVQQTHDRFWQNVDQTPERLRLLQEWNQTLDTLLEGRNPESVVLPQPFAPGTANRLLETLEKCRELDAPALDVLPLDQLLSLVSRQQEIPDILRACEALNQAYPNGAPLEDLLRPLPEGWTRFQGILQSLNACLRPESTPTEEGVTGFEPVDPERRIPVDADRLPDVLALLQAWAEDAKGLGRLLKGGKLKVHQSTLKTRFPELEPLLKEQGVGELLERLHSTQATLEEKAKLHPAFLPDTLLHGDPKQAPESITSALSGLRSLECEPVRQRMATLAGKPFERLSLAELCEIQERLDQQSRNAITARKVSEGAAQLGLPPDDLSRLYQQLRNAQSLLKALLPQDLEALLVLRTHAAGILQALDIPLQTPGPLFRFLKTNPHATAFLHWVRCHQALSLMPEPPPPDLHAISAYFDKNRKLSARTADERLSQLLHHSGDLSRIKTAIQNGKQLDPHQAGVLLRHLNCIIAEAPLLSKHFPMQADLIDLLIIDEASQVSIADSISLMLRAKQTIVFGDELQYGAVGAQNVSRNYSEAYFKEILDAYGKENTIRISEEEASRLAREASEEVDDDSASSSAVYPVLPGTREWLKTFSVRTSTLAFAKALQNYAVSLNTHFRSYPEIISYSNEVFYKPSEVELIPNRIRNKPIGEVLRFLKVETKGMSGRNVNLDEIEAIQRDVQERIAAGYKGSIGIICSFKEQTTRMEEMLRREMDIHPKLEKDHRFKIWFVGEVQGEERDTIYYTFVQDKKLDNADLRQIYPTIDGSADNIRKLKMQRLNVGFSRAKDSMVFVHSMDLGDYSDTRLGDALRHYHDLRQQTHDHYVEDESIFDSPAEKNLYRQILQTPFFQENRQHLRLIAQFEIGRYIRSEFHKHIPGYRVDFLLTFSRGGKETSLILEYDGLEYHTQNPERVTAQNFDREYLEYDIQRQIELESYGYRFLRIHKFSLLPTSDAPTPIAVLDRKLREAFR